MSVFVGSQLQAQVGSWNNNPTSFTYEWQDSPDGLSGWADTVDLSGTGAASDFIVPTAELGKFLSCLVTGTNVAGNSVQQRSTVVGPVIGPTLSGFWGIRR